MDRDPTVLFASILSGWLSDDPVQRLAAVTRIGELALQGIELPKEGAIAILRVAMYEDFRPYPEHIWAVGLWAAEKVCDAFSYDFNLFGPSDDHSSHSA